MSESTHQHIEISRLLTAIAKEANHSIIPFIEESERTIGALTIRAWVNGECDDLTCTYVIEDEEFEANALAGCEIIEENRSVFNGILSIGKVYRVEELNGEFLSMRFLSSQEIEEAAIKIEELARESD
jgi:hypothetical protein